MFTTLLGGLYALRRNNLTFRTYTDAVFSQFFKRELNIEDISKIAHILHASSNDKAWADNFAQKEVQETLDKELEDIRMMASKDKVSYQRY